MIAPQKNGILFVVSGPSGVGKTTLVRRLLEEYKFIPPLHHIVTYTTRHPRLGEIEGVDYYFIGAADFEHKAATGFFFECKENYGNYYGTSNVLLNFLEKGESCIIIVDPVGAEFFARSMPRVVLIWLEADSLEALGQRLIARGSCSEENRAMRIAKAIDEIAIKNKSDFSWHTIITRSVDESVRDLAESINKALGHKD